MIELHVVTPCARPENLEAIADSVCAARAPKDAVLDWFIVLDDRFDIDVDQVRKVIAHVPEARVEVARASGVAGHAQRNHALERIARGWIVFVDDDNLLHLALPSGLAAAIRRQPEAGVIVFDQVLGSGKIRRAAPENVRVGGVDSAQLALERSFVGDERFYVYSYCADGLLIESLYRKTPERFAFESKVMCSYNALTPGRWGELPPGRKRLGPLPDIHTAASLHFHRSFATDKSTEQPDHLLVRLRSGSFGDRLELTAPESHSKISATIMQSPLQPGVQRLSGVAMLDKGSPCAAWLGIDLLESARRTQRLADISLEPGARAELSAVFKASRGSDIAFTCCIATGAGADSAPTIKIDSLLISPESRYPCGAME